MANLSPASPHPEPPLPSSRHQRNERPAPLHRCRHTTPSPAPPQLIEEGTTRSTSFVAGSHCHASCCRCGGLSAALGEKAPNFSGMYDWSYFLLMLGLCAVASTAIICWGYLH